MKVPGGFLCSYLDSVLMIKQFPLADPVKGKMVIGWDPKLKKKEKKTVEEAAITRRWMKPRDVMVV